VVCLVPAIAAGDTASFTISVIPTVPGELVNVVLAFSLVVPDPNLDNDIGGATTTVVAAAPDPYDTYDDDPGDPGFDFDTPFEGAGDSGEPESDVPADVAASGDTAGAQPGADDSAGVGSGGIGSIGGDQLSLSTDGAEVEPAWLDQLPRTGLNVVVASLAGGILLVLGGGLRVGSRRQRRTVD
jgi:LPXTG-motif cell wall-anchored protein